MMEYILFHDWFYCCNGYQVALLYIIRLGDGNNNSLINHESGHKVSLGE